MDGFRASSDREKKRELLENILVASKIHFVVDGIKLRRNYSFKSISRLYIYFLFIRDSKLFVINSVIILVQMINELWRYKD